MSFGEFTFRFSSYYVLCVCAGRERVTLSPFRPLYMFRSLCSCSFVVDSSSVLLTFFHPCLYHVSISQQPFPIQANGVDIVVSAQQARLRWQGWHLEVPRSPLRPSEPQKFAICLARKTNPLPSSLISYVESPDRNSPD